MPCEDQGWYVVHHVSSATCLARGDATTVAQSPAFEVDLAPCDDSEDQAWSVLPSAGAYELRNVATDHNLDIRLAATADGTTAVLYVPHQLYNQRFFVREGPAPGFAPLVGGERWLAPRHAELQCLTFVPTAAPGSRLQLWPCDGARDDQKWELTELTCP